MSRSKEVLILDDDPAIAEALALMLEEVGYRAYIMRKGETIESLQEDVPGLLFLDIWMSGRDGRDICRYLKSQPATKSLPIILISANSQIANITREVGANDYLSKPFGMKEMLAKVRKYLQV